jgi:glycosyltransferase involved in cell wall biosynthesis
MKPKVAFIVHMLAPYRVTFYEKLFSDKDHQWKLFAGLKFRKDDPKPQFEGKVNYDVSYHKEQMQRTGMFVQLVYEGMLEAIQEYNPDVIIVFAHVGTKSFRQIVDWGKANGKKVVMWTCFWNPKHAAYKHMIRSYFVKAFYTKADYHLAYSTQARDRLVKIGVPQENIAIAYNGIDVAQYGADLMMDGAEAGFDHSVVNFLYVGAFGPTKGVDLLVKALAICKNQFGLRFNAHLIGDGPTRPLCQQLVSQHKLDAEVKLPGRLPKGIGKYFKAADCVVMPASGGLLINEAILFKKPIITAEADGTEVDLVVNGFNGIRFVSDSALSLAQSLTEMANNLRYYQENAVAALPLVTKRSNTDVMAETFTQMVRRALGESGPTPKQAMQAFQTGTTQPELTSQEVGV